MKTTKLLFFLFVGLLSQNIKAQMIDFFRDDFNNNDQNWSISSETAVETIVKGGEYTMTHKRNEAWYIFMKNVYMDPNKDFLIESKLKQNTGSSDDSYGIIWGCNGWGDCYYFDITSNGSFRVYKYESEKYVEMKAPTQCDKIKPRGQYNRVGVERSGGKLNFYINDTKVYMTTYRPNLGDYTGFTVGKNMSVSADYFFIKHPEIKINLITESISKYNKENMGISINSPYSEIAPVIAPDGKTLYIARAYHPSNTSPTDKFDIWYSTLDDKGEWSKMKNIGTPLNNSGDNVVIAVTPDNNALMVETLYNSSGGFLSDQGISISYKTATGWGVPKKINIKNYYNRNEYESFAPTGDRKVIVMSVQRDDSYGDKDLYVSFLQDDNSYSEPINMGKVLNSYADEGTPYIAPDNVTMYYYSRNQPGYGDADIFVTKRLDDTWTNWSTPKNLGTKINSDAWDVYYTVSAKGDYAYLVSSKNSMGREDIYTIKLRDEEKPNPVVIIYGKAFDKTTNKPISTTIQYENQKTGKTAGFATSNPVTGEYKVVLPYGVKYNLHATKKNYFAVNEEIDLEVVANYKEIEKDLWMTPLEIGKKIVLESVLFYSAKETLLPDSFNELIRLAEVMKENENMIIELQGHTDKSYTEVNPEADAKLLELSKKRVKTVKNYLISKGIKEARIQEKAFGGTKPIASNATDEGRKKNRRVEFLVIKM